MGWLNWWSKRKQLYISNGAATQSNYQLNIIVNYGSGTDSAGNIYCNSQSNVDFSDIRFTSSDGVTLLNYWIDNYSIISGTKCSAWVQVSSIPTGTNSTYIYVYYSNTSASTASSGTNTFPTLFDDFSGTFSKWTHESGCTYGGGTAGITAGTMYMTRTDASCGSGATTPLATIYGGWHFELYKTSGTQSNSGIFIDIDYARNYVLYYYTDGSVTLSGIGSTTSVTAGIWHAFDITRDLSGNWTVYIDGVSRITGTNNTYTTNTKLGLRTTSWPSGSTDYVDNVLYRSFVSSGPSWSTIGAEEWLNSFLNAGD